MTAADNALLKRDSRRLGWLMLLYILLFQLGTMVMVFATALLLSRIGFTLQDSSVLLIASDLTQALVGMLFLRLYLRERSRAGNQQTNRGTARRQTLSRCADQRLYQRLCAGAAG